MSKVNKAVLIDEVSAATGEAKKVVETIVNSLLDSVIEHLKKGEETVLFGFGSFKVKDRLERTARNPQTGEAVKVPARKSISFRTSKKLKDTVSAKTEKVKTAKKPVKAKK